MEMITQNLYSYIILLVFPMFLSILKALYRRFRNPKIIKNAMLPLVATVKTAEAVKPVSEDNVMNKLIKEMWQARKNSGEFDMIKCNPIVDIYELLVEPETGVPYPQKVGEKNLQEFVDSFFEDTQLPAQLAAIANGTQKPREGQYVDVVEHDKMQSHNALIKLREKYGDDWENRLLDDYNAALEVKKAESVQKEVEETEKSLFERFKAYMSQKSEVKHE